MQTVFRETFDSSLNGLPGGWAVEFNSDLKEVPAIRRGDHCIEFLSAGNKFLPVIPDVADFTLKSKFSFSIEATSGIFGLIISFRYDTVSGRGQAIRISRKYDSTFTLFEYGSMQCNIFTPVESKEITMEESRLGKPFHVDLELKDNVLKLSALGEKVSFKVKKGKGAIAISREHFYDILSLQALEIRSDSIAPGKKLKSFTVSLPVQGTFYPIYCDVTLTDYSSCMDADLTFRGGVKDTPTGEGNYHGIRADMIEKPYFKVLWKDSADKNTIYDDTIILMPDALIKPYYYKRIGKYVPWPFKRKVRFTKGSTPFDLAIGAESYKLNNLADLEQTPSETIFDLKGNVLYSGKGVTTDQICVRFHSQENKEMLKRLPAKNPRKEMAVDFVKKNHFFFEKEDMEFSMTLLGSVLLPATVEVTLEDVFFRKIRTLKHKMTFRDVAIGVRTVHEAKITVEKISGLAPGVYHVRLKSTDLSVEMLEDYCALEVMSRKKGALPPPLISQLPYMYNSRTETRGLLTDGFDPWVGESMNGAHYISCANFLPKAARDFDVIPTVHAYGREYFLWLGDRCCDKPQPKDNMDLLAQADYVNMGQPIYGRTSFLWTYNYFGWKLELFYECAKSTKDKDFNLKDLKKKVDQYRKLSEDDPEYDAKVRACCVSREDYIIMASRYWEKWLDAANVGMKDRYDKYFKEYRKINPRLKCSEYGPANIYAAHLKGPEFARILGSDLINPEYEGFWQYEDYPYACRYGLERGIYYMTSHLMIHPEARIYPEIYTGGGLQGCPDGAVFYAHPPVGKRDGNVPQRMMRQVYEHVFASAYFNGKEFCFWKNRGYQACGFTRPWFESLLKAWKYAVEYTPERPLRSLAFVSSENSRRANDRQFLTPHGGIIDVRCTASEDVPFLYEESRKYQCCAGFQVLEENLCALTEKDVTCLVLPPLKGMTKKTLDHIRKLHKKGVNLLACEDVTGLEDLFGVKDSGREKTISRVWADSSFECTPNEDFCDDERCVGRYDVTTADVLLHAEIPVLTLQENANGARAAFFNVPPHFVKNDRLHQRLGYGKDSISDLISCAAGKILHLLSDEEVTASCGRLIACKAANGRQLVIVHNPDDDNPVTVEVTVKKAPGREKISSECEAVYTKLPSGNGVLSFRVRLDKGGSAVLIFQ